MSSYLKLFLLTSMTFLQMASAQLSSFEGIYKSIEKADKDKALTEQKWVQFLKQVDDLCEKKQEYCEFYYMLESSLLMFEKDEYGDDGQCERTETNVNAYFNSQYPKQKKQVLSIVKKLCPEAQKNLNKN